MQRPLRTLAQRAVQESIADLAKRSNSIDVYACTNSAKIEYAKAIARKRRSEAELIKVVLDNN